MSLQTPSTSVLSKSMSDVSIKFRFLTFNLGKIRQGSELDWLKSMSDARVLPRSDDRCVWVICTQENNHAQAGFDRALERIAESNGCALVGVKAFGSVVRDDFEVRTFVFVKGLTHGKVGSFSKKASGILVGTKGYAAVQADIANVSFTIVGVHLPFPGKSGDETTAATNSLHAILGRFGRKTDCFILGDLNYRVHERGETPDKDRLRNAVAKLTSASSRRPLEIVDLTSTLKMATCKTTPYRDRVPAWDVHNASRTPSFCDRVLYVRDPSRGNRLRLTRVRVVEVRAAPSSANSLMNVNDARSLFNQSDHLPVMVHATLSSAPNIPVGGTVPAAQPAAGGSSTSRRS